VNAIQWNFIQELRSGAYKEGNMRLLWKGHYTPAGVLCKLYLEYHELPWTKAPWRSSNEHPDKRMFIGIPQQVARWADIPLQVMVDITHLNDIHSYTFPQIADHLEKALKYQRPARRGRVASRWK